MVLFTFEIYSNILNQLLEILLCDGIFPKNLESS